MATEDRGPAKNVLVDVWLISTLASSLVDAALAGSPMSTDEFALYGLIVDLGPLTAADLARATGLPPTTLSGVLARCERRGEIERVANPADRRSALLRLTDRGMVVYRTALPGLIDLLSRLDAAAPGGGEPIRHALQTLDDALREVAGTGERPYRLTPPRPASTLDYPGPPLTPAQQREARRFIEWLRYKG
jgi:DNA-binding MarR family transcriptional regulator